MLELYLYFFRNQFCDFVETRKRVIFFIFSDNAKGCFEGIQTPQKECFEGIQIQRKKDVLKEEIRGKITNKIESENGKYSFFKKST